MNDVVIRAENLGKRYRIGERAPYLTLRDALARAITAPLRGIRSSRTSGRADESNEIWALKDISFEVRRGEVIGIIGRNGSGKSTLLKILSRVTKPTVGRAQIRGRLGSLLEVGTGFHPELTGRENTYLNGAILGMSKRDIAKRFDEIVAFAEIEKFIDTPVKHYSSGMYVRLAFSVAAHMEPEILLVDEVLAVGDIAFQKKCLGRMEDVARQGRTVLFVSHNMGAVALLCKSVIVLDQGRIQAMGDSERSINEYLIEHMDRDTEVYQMEGVPRPDPTLRREVEFLSLQLAGPSAKLVPSDADLTVLMTVRGNQAASGLSFSLTIHSVDGGPLGTCFGEMIHSVREGEIATFRMKLENPRLAPGAYRLDLGVGTGDEQNGFRLFDATPEVLYFEVMAPPGTDGTVSEWRNDWGAIRFQRPATERCN